MKFTMSVLPDGTSRSIWSDDWHPEVDPGAVQRRASRVEVIPDGPQKGRFHVDFSPLGEEYRFCLAQTFVRYRDAVAAEVAWLTKHWVKGA